MSVRAEAEVDKKVAQAAHARAWLQAEAGGVARQRAGGGWPRGLPRLVHLTGTGGHRGGTLGHTSVAPPLG